MSNKNKNNKNQKQAKQTTALVVYQKPKPKTLKKHSLGKRGKYKSEDGLNSYRAALMQPFSIEAQGARVPDMYCAPTATRHITKTFTVSTNASGEADIIVLPSCYFHAVSTRGSLVGGAVWATVDGADQTSGLQYTDPSVLAAHLTNHRIVGYGVKVFGIQSMTGTAGKVLLATVPMSSWCNDRTATVGGRSSNSVNTSATRAGTLVAWGIPTSGNVVDIASMPSLPNSMETSLVRATEVPLQVIPKIISPEAFNFRETKDNAIGFALTQQLSPTAITTGDCSYLRIAGHEAVVIALTGCNNSASVLEVEVVYHIEGNPYQNTTGFAVIGNDATRSFVNPTGWMNIVQQVAKAPAFKSMVETAGNTVFPGLGTLANKFF